MSRSWIFGLLAGLLLLAQAAGASPWGRPEGQGFLSLVGEWDRDGNGYASLYGEYGLTARNMLGFELGRATVGEVSALLWLQRSMDDGSGPNRWVLTLGAGMVRRDGSLIPLAQIGAGWGRGFDSLPGLQAIPGGGWLALETRAKLAGTMQDSETVQELAATDAGLFSYLSPETTAKAELTIGWNATPATMLINQFRLESRDDTGFSSVLSTSVVQKIHGPVSLEAGLLTPLSGGGETALRIGTWLQF